MKYLSINGTLINLDHIAQLKFSTWEQNATRYEPAHGEISRVAGVTCECTFADGKEEKYPVYNMGFKVDADTSREHRYRNPDAERITNTLREICEGRVLSGLKDDSCTVICLAKEDFRSFVMPIK